MSTLKFARAHEAQVSRNMMVAIAFAVLGSASMAQTSGDNDQTKLAKQLSNPIASLTSVPFQFNRNDGYGDGDGSQTYLNFQPVVPFALSGDLSLIVRTIVPIVEQKDYAPGYGTVSGLGDVTQSFFISPSAPGPGGLIWGAGPVFLWPTSSERDLGSQKWGAGVTAVGLVQKNAWTVGALANHIWSYADKGADGDQKPDVNATFVQPFVAYTLKTATTLSLNTESTYNWEADQWSVPINFQINQMFKLGKQPAQIGLGARYWAESPEGGPDGWGARLNLVLLFPKKPS